MNIEYSEALAIERPQNTVGIKLETAEQMRRLLDIQRALQIERGIVLQEAAAPGVIVICIIQFGSGDEHITCSPCTETASTHVKPRYDSYRDMTSRF
jgi:hypothetical protein